MGIGNKILLGILAVILTTTIMATGKIGELLVPSSYPVMQDLLTALASLLVGGVAAWILSGMIARRMESLVAATRVISGGDLTKRVAVVSRDELGQLAYAFNQMVVSLREVVGETKDATDMVSQSTDALSATVEVTNKVTEEIALRVDQIAKGAERQAVLVADGSDVVHELAHSTNQIAARAHSAAQAAVEAGNTAESGGKSSQETMRKLEDVFSLLEGLAAEVKGFGAKTQQIGIIVDLITRIAHQTHLLALNATIEAARAGEHGRGFAVVADEVRKLAGDAGSSAEQIAKLAHEVREESGHVVTSMGLAVKEIGSGRQALRFTEEALQEIVRTVVQQTKRVQEISHLTEQQTVGAETLVKTIDEIAMVARDHALSTQQASMGTQQQITSMEQMALSAQELSVMADKLREKVSRFRIDG
ncbi:MAG: methyl-accepting chemotaxis protein [candidate division NC10 bacterium]|nr:methyl-accepting chemotaxis protein [candidate division NC10 bacterium]